MSWFALVLIVAALALAAGVLPRRQGQPAGVPAFVVVVPTVLLAALMVVLLMGAAHDNRFGDVRVVLQGLSVNIDTLKGRPLSIGGDRDQDFIVVDRLPPQAAVIRTDATGEVRLTARPSAPSSGRVEFDGDPAKTTVVVADKPVEAKFYRIAPGAAGRPVETRALHLVVAGGRLQVLFDTPAVQVISRAQLVNALQLRRNAGDKDVALAFSGASSDLSSLPFAVLGEKARSALFARFLLSGSADRFTLVDDRGSVPVGFGRAFQAGGDIGALMRIDRVDLHWAALRHLPWLPIAALVLALCGTWRQRRRSPAAFLILSLLDLLLVLRLVLAVEAAYVSEAERIVLTVRDAYFALLAAPFFIASLDPSPSDRVERLGYGAITLLSIVVLAATSTAMGGETPVGWAPGVSRALQEKFGVSVFLALALCIAGIARTAMLGRRLPEPLMRTAVVAADGAARFVDRYAARPMEVIRQAFADERCAWAPIALLVLVAMVRAALALVGITEAVEPLGVRISLSMIYTPLTLGLFVWALARIGRSIEGGGPRPWMRLAALWAALAAVFGAMFAVRDTGYIVTNSETFLLWAALAAVTAAAASRTSRLVLALPGALVVLVFVAASLSAHLASPGPDRIAQALAAPTSPQAHRVLSAYAADQGNLRRIEAVFAPQSLAVQGSQQAQRDRQVNAHMRAYSDTWFGRGWLNLERPSLLAKTQLDDNLSAVHIISPFGRTGAAALLLIEGLVAALATLVVVRRDGIDLLAAPVGSAFGLVCLWTLFLVSAYMVLANALIVPFTGRDVYLLAAASHGDLIEGLLLIGISFRLLVRGDAA